jgi:flagellar biosynthesis protein FlhG
MNSAESATVQADSIGRDQASRLRELFAPPKSREKETSEIRRPTPIIAITSGKGGVGKTNIAVNLCAALAQAGRRVTLVDADLGMANADVLCGISPSRRLHHALPISDGHVHGRLGTHPSAAIDLTSIGVRTSLGFTLVPGSVGVARMADLETGEQRALLRALSALEAQSEVVVLDTGAGISSGVLSFLGIADLVLVVATPEPTSITDAYALMKCVTHRFGGLKASSLRSAAPSLRLVVNQSRDQCEAERVHGRISRAAQGFLNLQVPFAGWIPRDGNLPEAVMARSAVILTAPRSPSAAAIRSLAGSLSLEWPAQTADQGCDGPSVFGLRLARLRRALQRRGIPA